MYERLLACPNQKKEILLTPQEQEILDKNLRIIKGQFMKVLIQESLKSNIIQGSFGYINFNYNPHDGEIVAVGNIQNIPENIRSNPDFCGGILEIRLFPGREICLSRFCLYGPNEDLNIKSGRIIEASFLLGNINQN